MALGFAPQTPLVVAKKEESPRFRLFDRFEGSRQLMLATGLINYHQVGDGSMRHYVTDEILFFDAERTSVAVKDSRSDPEKNRRLGNTKLERS